MADEAICDVSSYSFPLREVLCVKLAYYWMWKSAANAVPSCCVCVAFCAISPPDDRRANKNAFSRLGSPIEIDPTKNQAKASQLRVGVGAVPSCSSFECAWDRFHLRLSTRPSRRAQMLPESQREIVK